MIKPTSAPSNHDPDRQAVDAELVLAVQSLYDDGIDGHQICRALLNLLLSTCLAEYEADERSHPWAKDFLQVCAETFKDTREKFDRHEACFDDFAHSI